MRLKLENNTIFLFLLTSLNGGGGKSLYNLLKSLRSLFLKRLSSHFICFFCFIRQHFIICSKAVWGYSCDRFMPERLFGVKIPFIQISLRAGVFLSVLSERWAADTCSTDRDCHAALPIYDNETANLIQ